jgi:hypothetical protein
MNSTTALNTLQLVLYTVSERGQEKEEQAQKSAETPTNMSLCVNIPASHVQRTVVGMTHDIIHPISWCPKLTS